jgi:uncharacterized protein (AIM24 family)
MRMTTDRLACGWCQAQNELGRTSCSMCGAPLDVAELVTESGWRTVPKVRDATRFGFSRSTCEVEGEIVPVISIALGAGDWVFFEHHTMLWKDAGITLGQLVSGGGLKRLFGGMPFMITKATGPGHVAFSRDSAGELVVLPVHPNQEIDVREHAFLVGSHSLSYSFERIKGLANWLYGGAGMYLERFITQGESGLLMLHGSGNVFERTLKAGESIWLEPGAFLYKDSTVTMQAEKQNVKAGLLTRMYLAKMTGPGRVGIQSMYHPHAGGSED